MGISLKNGLFRNRGFQRSAARYHCKLDASLIIVDRIISFTGRVTDISKGGALFRPRLTYLLFRREVPVCLLIGRTEVYGRITGTSSAGYGIRFDEPISDELLVHVINDSSINNSDAGAGRPAGHGIDPAGTTGASAAVG